MAHLEKPADIEQRTDLARIIVYLDPKIKQSSFERELEAALRKSANNRHSYLEFGQAVNSMLCFTRTEKPGRRHCLGDEITGIEVKIDCFVSSTDYQDARKSASDLLRRGLGTLVQDHPKYAGNLTYDPVDLARPKSDQRNY